MSSITMSPSAQVSRSYLNNVGHAALSLLAALVAVNPSKAQAKGASATAERADEPKEVSVARLYRLARSYETVSPSLAQELRAIAQRG